MRQWDDLRYFLAVARRQTLSGAARDLDVNHATVYRRLNGLEGELGLRLFERLQTGYVLTHEGEALVPYAERVEAEVLALDRRLTGCDWRLSGPLTVTTVDDVLHGLLMKHFAAFLERYPEIQLEILTDARFFNLNRREADIAIRPAPRPDPAAIARPLGTLRGAVYGTPAYLEAHPPVREASDLAGHRIIRGDESMAHIASEQWLDQHVDPSSVVLRTNGMIGQHAAVRAGLGLATLPCFLGDADAELVRVLPVDEQPPTVLWLLYHPDLRGTARVRAFVELIETAFAADRPLLEGECPRG